MLLQVRQSAVFIAGTLIMGLICACGQTQKKNGKQSPKTAYEKITTIEGIPAGIDGCSCALSRNQEEFEAEKFIYLESYGKLDPKKNISILSLDGEQLEYPRKQSPKGLNVLVLYESKEGGKSQTTGSRRTGKLVVKQENGATLKENFYGVCGC